MLQATNTVSHADAPRLFAPRAALLFCAPMMVNGIGLLYFPIFLEDLRMSDVEIGIIISIPFLVRMIGTPLGTALADRVSDRAVVLVWSASISLLTTATMYFTQSFWPVIFLYAVQSLFYAPYVPIAEAILVTGVKRWGFDYGFLRLWGSVAFVFATLVGGWLLDLYGGAMVLPAMAFFFSVTIAVAIGAPRLGRATPPVEAMQARGLEPNPFWRADFLLLIVGAGLVQGSHGLLFSFATIYWSSQDISGLEISFLWTAGVVAEILLFYLSGRYLARFDNSTLVLFGCLVAVGRWALFPVVDGFWPHLLLQSMHAFTFAIIHVGIQRFMMDRVGDERGASAQGFYQFWVCLFNVVTTWSSGFIFQAYGVNSFYAMSLVAAAGVTFVIGARFFQPQSVRSGG